jgi:peptidoglycan/LPS O-acetylase OafA/YrhL
MKYHTHLDFLRGMAAILVCAGHWRACLFAGFGEVQSPSMFIKAVYLFTSFGHEAVMVFFCAKRTSDFIERYA